MDGLSDERVGGWRDGWMDGWMDEKINGWNGGRLMNDAIMTFPQPAKPSTITIKAKNRLKIKAI